MTDISLRQYLGRIDALLEDELYDQAAFHCQHILQQLPKNVAVYRRLGQAFLFSRRWEDAAEVLRRVLSVAPDDRGAHIGLSRCYYHLRQQVESIWHLERAFEHDTSNQDVINDLRRLYREYREIDQPRLQLTTGAIARQYARNGLYDQAVDVLSKVLREKPDRFDLRLLRARILHESGRIVDAAESAIDLLTMLPDCLEANYILAELWLSEQRPSDAQRFLSRIEQVDPYLALKLALGNEPDDHAVIVTEGDYQRAASRHTIETSPDWLHGIDTERAGTEAPKEVPAAPEPAFPTLDFLDADSDLMETASGATVPTDAALDWEPEEAEQWGEIDSDDDWLTQAARADIPTEQPATDFNSPAKKSTGLTGLLASLHEDDLESAIPAEQSALIEEPAADDSEAEQIAAQLAGVGDEYPDLDLEVPLPSVPANDKEDPFAWMHTSGIEFVDTPIERYRPSLTDDINQGELIDPENVDPLAWMRDSGLELLQDDSEVPASDEADDPMAWLRDSDIELVEEQHNNTATTDDDPMAWLRATGIELEEDEQLASSAQQMPADEHALDWLADESLLDELLDIEAMVDDEVLPSTAARQSSIEPEDASAQSEDFADFERMFADSEQVDGQDTMPDKNNTENHDWLDPEDNEENWLEQPDSESAATPTPDDKPFVLDWLNEEDAEEETRQTNEPLSRAETMFDWMDEEKSVEAASAPAADDQPADDFIEPALFGDTDNAYEWSVQAETPPASGMNFEAADDEEDEDAFAPFGGEETPDWLAETAPTSEVSSDAGDEETPDWLTESSFASGMNFEAADDEEDEDAFAPFGSEETPDWLVESAPSSEVSFDAVDEEEDEDAFAPFGSEETPDWLTEAAPTSEVSSEAADEEDEDAFAPFGSEETPDWLTEATPSSGSSFDEEDEEDNAFTPFGGEEMPDWLTAATPTSDAADDEEEDTFALFDDEKSPDWLTAAAPLESDALEEQDTFAQIPAAASFQDQGFSWDESDDDEAFVHPQEQPAVDWEDHEMRAFDAIDDGVENAAGDRISEDTPDWLIEAFPQGEQTPAVDDNMSREDFVEEAEFGTDDQAQWSAEERPVSAQEEFAYPFEQGPVIQNELYEETEAQSQAAIPGDFDQEVLPLELLDENEDADFDADFEGEFDEDEFDIAFDASFEDELDADEDVAPIPADNAPDWLNAMVPGLDINYAAEEDEQTEQSFLEPEYREMESRPAAPRQDIDWLNDIVEEEANKPPTSLPAFPPAAKAPVPEPQDRQPRFSFSRPPAWMRHSSPAPAEPGVARVDELDDLDDLKDFDDFDDLDDLDGFGKLDSSDDDFGDDLPDWLDLDNRNDKQ